MFGFATNVHAIENPLSVPNNKFGVHILFTSELDEAARLINSSGGDWGYVTIPIQAGDRDLEKWQKFMSEAAEKHIIPIIRLASENYYFDTKVWRKPNYNDILDFANFLNSLNWPVKNRYITVFNEVNRGDEWGGSPNPKEYAEILNYSTQVFKSLNPDFFIISAGLDNAAPNIENKFMNQYRFISQMDTAVPGIFSQIDGLGSHSYPNPGFSQPPTVINDKSISSFKFENDLVFELSGKKLPIFITETGWSTEKVSQDKIASYFVSAFESVWSDNNIVAVTPFLLQAGTGPFLQFSLLDENGGYNDISESIQKISKIKGEPLVNNQNSSFLSPNTTNLPLKTFPEKIQYEPTSAEETHAATFFLKWLLKVNI